MYQRQMKLIEGAFNKTFWQGKFYRSPTHKGETDDRANALAVVAGLASPDYYPAITDFLKHSMHASPYMEKYVLESLFLMDQPDAALDRMLLRYAAMIDCPITTLWENFARPGVNEPGSGTYNHAWSGGPLTLLQQYVAGIEPTQPGFKSFSVKPKLGSLTRVETTVPTPHGSIELRIARDDSEGFTIKLVVPQGTVADFQLGSETNRLEEGSHSWSVKPRI